MNGSNLVRELKREGLPSPNLVRNLTREGLPIWWENWKGKDSQVPGGLQSHEKDYKLWKKFIFSITLRVLCYQIRYRTDEQNRSSQKKVILIFYIFVKRTHTQQNNFFFFTSPHLFFHINQFLTQYSWKLNGAWEHLQPIFLYICLRVWMWHIEKRFCYLSSIFFDFLYFMGEY